MKPMSCATDLHDCDDVEESASAVEMIYHEALEV